MLWVQQKLLVADTLGYWREAKVQSTVAVGKQAKMGQPTQARTSSYCSYAKKKYLYRILYIIIIRETQLI